MPYTILNPASPHQVPPNTCALAVMAKAPRAGKVKTRLTPPLTPAQGAALNVCFLMDTTENIAAVAEQGGSAGLISYTPVGDESLFEGILPRTFALIPQRGDAFGERLLAAAQDILACGYASVCLIDSDSPTVPAAVLTQAVAELDRPGDRIVLGPSHDGGYYLIGLKHPHPTPFQSIAWSTSSVCSQTIERIHAAGIDLILLPIWYDVDEGAALDTLCAELLTATPPHFATVHGYPAPHTAEFLMEFKNADDYILQLASAEQSK